MTLFRFIRSSTLAASIAGTLAISACDEGAAPKDQTPAAPKAGDQWFAEYGVGDRAVERTTYRFVDLEEPGVEIDPDAPGTSLALFVESVEVIDSRLAPDAEETATPSQVREFLRYDWDRYIGGVEDAGVNAREFVATLNEIGLDINTFMRELPRSGLELERFIDIGKELASLQDARGRRVFADVIEVLDEHGLELADFDVMCEQSGESAATFAAKLLDSEQAANDGLTDSELGSASTVGSTPVKAGFAIERLSWDVIKDSKPITDRARASSYLLNPEDTDAASYEGATSFENAKQYWWVKNGFGVTLTSASWHVKGTHNATNSAFAGWYLPSVYVDFVNVATNWPGKISATAGITDVSNRGTVAEPNPGAEVAVKITMYDGFSGTTKTFKSTVYGKK